MKLSTLSVFATFAPLLTSAAPQNAARQTESPTTFASVHASASALRIDLSAVPAWEPVEALGLVPINPGEGLPTLQDLNVMWSTLLVDPFERTTRIEERSTSLVKRATTTCKMGDVIDIYYAGMCANYLLGLGTTNCIVQGWYPNAIANFCDAGGVWWRGTLDPNPTGFGFVTQWCQTVAYAGLTVLDRATTPCKVYSGGEWYNTEVSTVPVGSTSNMRLSIFD